MPQDSRMTNAARQDDEFRPNPHQASGAGRADGDNACQTEDPTREEGAGNRRLRNEPKPCRKCSTGTNVVSNALADHDPFSEGFWVALVACPACPPVSG